MSALQATGSFETASIIAYSLVDGTRKVVHRSGYHGRYVRSGHLLYVREGSIFAAPFDVEKLEVIGRAVPALQGVSTNANNGGAHFSVSDQGTLVYLPGEGQLTRAPIRWIDRTAKTEMLRSTVSDWSNPSFAPDGTRLAVDINDGTQTDVWVYEWSRDTLTRLTFDQANDARPIWSPTGKYIVYGSQRDGGVSNLYLQRADGTGDVVRLTENRNAQFASSWHPSGKYLAYFETVPGKATDLMILPLEGDEATGWKPGKPQVFLSERFTESSGMFSPDGRWIAYMSNESGRNDIYVRPFPGPGGKWQISTNAADDPTWSRTSRDLYFVNTADFRIMDVPYQVDGDSFRADKPVVWIDTRVGIRPRPPSRDLDLHPDGKRFAIASTDEEPRAVQNRLVFVFNFFDELRRVAPAKTAN
jgi:serine/threonine-protein kinase